jgi:hypothetical protein
LKIVIILIRENINSMLELLNIGAVNTNYILEMRLRVTMAMKFYCEII